MSDLVGNQNVGFLTTWLIYQQIDSLSVLIMQHLDKACLMSCASCQDRMMSTLAESMSDFQDYLVLMYVAGLTV